MSAASAIEAAASGARTDELAAALPRSRMPQSKDCHYLRWRGAIAAAAAAVLFGFLAVAVPVFTPEDDGIVCPAPIAARSHSSVVPDGAVVPSTFLAEARRQLDIAAKEQVDGAVASAGARRALDACASWTAKPLGAKPQIGEVRAQLECRAVLVDEFGDSGAAEAADLDGQSFQLFEQAQVILQRCGDIANELQTIRRTDRAATSPGAAIMSLSMLSSLERPSEQALAGLSLSYRLLQARVQEDQDESSGSRKFDGQFGDFEMGEDMLSLEQVGAVRVGLRGCLLRAVREARAITSRLPATGPQVRRAATCTPRMLTSLEELAVMEARKEADPGVLFALGMHQSELALSWGGAGNTVTAALPLFEEIAAQDATWAVDGAGMEVPSVVAAAEEFMLSAERTSTGLSLQERSILRAKRIAQHAQGVLVPLGLHEAAATRFRDAAGIFAALGQPINAARALSDLAEQLSRNGDHEASVAAAGEALVHDPDEPVALYLQATMRRSLGALRTDEDVHVAKQQLNRAAGRLPGRELEARRAAAYAEIAGWGAVAESGNLATCFELQDVARVLICALCRLAYA